ncbi:MAG: leucine-rich repeat domain-containing protein [Clostridia bacterium]|nr:leucine-rich repeat domain-containing protein [Clostridia bacterium]
MKKSFVFSICFVLVLVALAFTIGAAPTFGDMEDAIDTIPDAYIFGDGDHHSNSFHDGYYNENCAKVMITYTKDGVTKTVTYPSYYVLKNSTTLTWDFAKVSQVLGVELNVGNIKAIQIPNGITDIPSQAFVLPGAFDPTESAEHPHGHVKTPNETLEYVFLANTVLTIGDVAFAHCTNLYEVGSNVSANGATGDHNHQMLRTVGYRAFHNCEKLTSFNFNNHLTHLGEGSFEGCNITSIDLSKCVELTVIPKNCFHKSNAGTVEKIILPTSIKEIQDNAFTGANADLIFLGTHLEKIGHNAISMADIDVVILPATIREVYDDSIDFGNKGYKTFVISIKSADNPEDIALVQGLLDAFDNAGVDWKNLQADKLCSDSYAYFTNAENKFCETYLGGHTINHDSDSITSVNYPNGINHQGYATGSCGVCTVPLEDTIINLTPILVSKGYSLCMYNDLYAFSNGFEVYHDALSIYERVNGTCELGILFLSNDRYQSVDLRSNINSMGLYFDENSLMTEGQITYESMDYIMTYSKGLIYDVTKEDGTVVTVNRGEVQIVIAAYMLHLVQTDKSTYYVQDADDIYVAGQTSDGKYNTVSYDSIYGTAKSQGLL